MLLYSRPTSSSSHEERKRLVSWKFPEEYLDKVWAENQEEQEEDKRYC